MSIADTVKKPLESPHGKILKPHMCVVSIKMGKEFNIKGT